MAQRVGRGIAVLLHDSGVSGQQHAPAVLYPRERPGTHCTGGWAGPQGRSGRAENLTPPGFDPRTVQPVAQSLYRLSYPAHQFFYEFYFNFF